MNEEVECELCGAPMPTGEEMFRYHGHSGPCPRPPMVPRTTLRDNTLKCGICGHSEQEFIDLQRDLAAVRADLEQAKAQLPDKMKEVKVVDVIGDIIQQAEEKANRADKAPSGGSYDLGYRGGLLGFSGELALQLDKIKQAKTISPELWKRRFTI